MRKDLSRSESGSVDRVPVRRSQFLSPWLDDYFETPRWLDTFFNRELAGLPMEGRFLSPAIDIEETPEEFLVIADLPGIKKDDVNIEYANNQLTITAERKYESKGNKQDRRERFFGTYQRSFTLPMGIEEDNIEASFEDGVLTVHVPKGEQTKARRIAVGEKKADKSQKSKH